MAACAGAVAPTGTPPAPPPSSASPSVGTAETLPSVPTPIHAVLALAKRDHTLAIVDPTTLGIVARIPVGEDPHEVIATADGRFAYVSNYGGGAYHALAVVDLVHQKALPSVDLGALTGPHGLVSRGGKIWFTAEGAKAIGSYDPASQKIDWLLGTGQDRTHMLFVWDDQKRIVTANVSSGTMSFIEKKLGGRDGGGPPGGPPPGAPSGSPRGGPPPGHGGPPGGDWDETVVPVGHGPEGFDVSPDGNQVWVANAHDGTVSIIDASTKTVSQTLSADVQGANRLKFTLDGKRVLISTLRGGDLSVIDATTRLVVKRVPLGRGAAGILMDPDGARAYVACSPDDRVVVVDLKTFEIVGHVDVGREPDGLAWAARR